MLTAEVLEAVVSGLQTRAGGDAYPPLASATAKHFVAYSLENPREGFDPAVDEGWLRSYYFPAFQAAVRDAKVPPPPPLPLLCRSSSGAGGPAPAPNLLLLEGALRVAPEAGPQQ